MISPLTTTRDLAKEMGRSDRSIEQYLQIARALNHKLRNRIRNTPLADRFTDLLAIARIKDPKRREVVIKKMTGKNPPPTVKAATREHRIEAGEIPADLDIIKPSNWWAFGRPKYMQPQKFPGSIPGEVYANALYYFAPLKGIAADGMAGSGMLKRVYHDRKRWEKDLRFDLDIRLFDLHPRAPFAKKYHIQKHDMRKSLPIKVDWLFIDPPYFGISAELYEGDLAQTVDYSTYLSLMRQVIQAAHASLKKNGVFCLLASQFVDLTDPNRLVRDVPTDLYAIGLKTGLTPVARVFVSRGEQQRPWAGQTNLKAKRLRCMFSDVCELLVFRRGSK